MNRARAQDAARRESPHRLDEPTAGRLHRAARAARADAGGGRLDRGRKVQAGGKVRSRAEITSCGDGSGCASGVSFGRPCGGLSLGDDWPYALLRCLKFLGHDRPTTRNGRWEENLPYNGQVRDSQGEGSSSIPSFHHDAMMDGVGRGGWFRPGGPASRAATDRRGPAAGPAYPCGRTPAPRRPGRAAPPAPGRAGPASCALIPPGRWPCP